MVESQLPLGLQMGQGWDQLGIFRTPSFSKFPKTFSPKTFPHYRSSSTRSLDYRSYQTCFGFNRRVVKSIYGSKTQREISTNNKSKFFKHSDKMPLIQNGHYKARQRALNSKDLDDVDRPLQRLLTSRSSRGLSEVPRFCLERKTLGFQSHAFRTMRGSETFHPNYQTCDKQSTCSWNSSHGLLGRFSCLERFRGGVQRGHSLGFERTKEVRFHGQPREESPCSFSDPKLARPHLGFCSEPSVSYSRLQKQDCSSGEAHEGKETSIEKRSRSLDRHSKFCLSSPAFRQVPSESNNQMDEPIHRLGDSRQTSSPVRPQTFAPLVGEGVQPNLGRSSNGLSRPSHYYDRRIPRGLRSCPRWSDSLRTLVTQRIANAHKFPGTSCGDQSLVGLETPSVSETNNNFFRQYDGPGNSESPRITSFSTSTQALCESSEITFRDRLCGTSSTHTRRSQRHSRLFIQERSHRVGMVARLENFRRNRRAVWPSRSGSLCYSPKLPTSSLYKSVYRRRSSRYRRFISRSFKLVKDVLFSSSKADSPTYSADLSSQIQAHSSSTSLEESVVVPCVSEITTESHTSEELHLATDDSRRCSQTLTSKLLQLNRVDFLTYCLIKLQGFSSSIAKSIVNSVRPSSLKQYQTVWSRLQSFLREINCSHLSLHSVLKFFNNLFDSGLRPLTIVRYRSALVWPLHFCNLNLLDKNVNRLFSNFAIRKPSIAKLEPQWSVDRVLTLLGSEDYRNNSSISLENLLEKTIFLFALASGSRVSELSALSRHSSNLVFLENSSRVELRPDAKFIYKNQSVKRIPPPIVIPALISSNGTDPLCPLDALKSYVDRSEYLSSDDFRLWIDPISDRPLTKTGITKRFCSLVNRSQETPTNVNIHQSRAMAVSLAYRAGLSVSEILSRAFWSSSTPFFNNYLVNVNSNINCIALGAVTS